MVWWRFVLALRCFVHIPMRLDKWLRRSICHKFKGSKQTFVARCFDMAQNQALFSIQVFSSMNIWSVGIKSNQLKLWLQNPEEDTDVNPAHMRQSLFPSRVPDWRNETNATSSTFVTALNVSLPFTSVNDLNNPTPSKKLRAFCLAPASGTTASACLFVNS